MVCPRPLETGCAGICTLKCASWAPEVLVLSFLTSGVAAVVLLASVFAGAVVLVLLVGGGGVEPADDVALMDMRAFQDGWKAAV